MKSKLSPNQDFPACGYGLSGLCCSACLLGPCRISPFERDIEMGKCGASADRLVAGNLLRMIAAETASRLADLVQIVNQTGASPMERPAGSSEKPEAAKAVFEKYGLDMDTARKTGGIAPLAAEIKDLLDLNPPARDPAAFWSRLYPVDIFPQFYSGEMLPEGSLAMSGLSAFRSFLRQDESPGDLLRKCLKISLIYMICDELIQDLEILGGARSFPEIPKTESKAAEVLSPNVSPGGVVLLSAPDRGFDGFDRSADAFRNHWQGPLVEISRPAEIFGISRQFFQRWSRPPADTAPLVIALTSSAALVVGILVCGYTAVAWPGLPFFGSRPAMGFFSRDLERVCGSVYLPPGSGDILTVVQNHFREKP